MPAGFPSSVLEKTEMIIGYLLLWTSYMMALLLHLHYFFNSFLESTHRCYTLWTASVRTTLRILTSAISFGEASLVATFHHHFPWLQPWQSQQRHMLTFGSHQFLYFGIKLFCHLASNPLYFRMTSLVISPMTSDAPLFLQQNVE